MRMIRHTLLFFGLCTTMALVAQDQQGVPSGEIEDQQVIIEKDKPLTLPQANRIYQRTDITAIEVDTVRMDYQITQPTYDFNPYTAEFKFRPYEVGSASGQIFPNYIKAGFGNYGSPLIQGYFGVDYEANHAGIWVNHESFSKGPVRDDESAYNLSEVLLNGTLKSENASFSPELYYQREGYYFYGYDAERLEMLAPQTHPFIRDRVAANHFSLSADVDLWQVGSYRLSVKPFYQFTNMLQKGEDAYNRENVAGVSGDFTYDINEELKLGLTAGYRHLNYESGIEQVRDVVKVHPYIVYHTDILSLKGGIKYFAANDSIIAGMKSYIYPDLQAHVKLSPDLAVFAHLSGDLKPSSLNEFRLRNRYLEDSLALLNESVKLDFKGGVEFNLTEKALLRGYVTYSQTDRKALFFHSPSDSSRFSVLYDPENFNQFGLGIEGKYYLGSKTGISAEFQVNGFDTDTVSEAWYLPVVRLDLSGSHTINETLTFRANIAYLDGIKAPDPVTFESVDLNAIVDLGAGVQYDFMENAGAFIDVKNILSANYERYLNYPSRGFMIKLGFIYRF